MNISEVILSRGRSGAIALLRGESELSYGDLRQLVVQRARVLLETGCRKGDRVGIWSENNFFWVVSYLAAIRAGLVAVPFQTDSTREGFQKVARNADLRLLVISRRFESRLRAWAEELSIPVMIEGEHGSTGHQGQINMPDIVPDRDLAALMFTSGSTGEPRGVMVTHRNIETNTSDIISYLGLAAQDRAMLVLPLSYCFGASVLHTHLMAGASVVMNNDFKLFPESVLRDMQRTTCTGLAGVPSTFQILLRRSRFRQMEFPALRWLQQAGGKLPNGCIQELQQSFPNVRFYTMYGQTEATARLSYLPPEHLNDKLGSIGRGLPSTQLEVLRPDGTPVEPGSDETGEIVASGANIAMGYWRDPEETVRFFKEAKLRTGDIARIDKDGFIYVLGRKRDFIKSGGNRVSSKEIEEVISALPEVVEAAVVGVAHELLGESIHAFLVLNPNTRLGEADIRAHCARHLSVFKIPEQFHFMANLPHSSSGKVVKSYLEAIALGGAGAVARDSGAEPKPGLQDCECENKNIPNHVAS